MYLRNLRRSELGEAEHVEAQAAEGRVQRLLVEDADDRVLAVDGRHDRDAEVDGAALHAQAEAPVLGHALLRDVQLGHDLDAADDGLVVALVQRAPARDRARRRCGTWPAPRGPWSRCGCRRRGGRWRPGSASRPGARSGCPRAGWRGRRAGPCSSSPTSCRRSDSLACSSSSSPPRWRFRTSATRAARRHHGLDRAAEVELDLVHLQQVVEAAEGEDQAPALAAARARSRSAPAARAGPPPTGRGRRAARSRGSKGSCSASAWRRACSRPRRRGALAGRTGRRPRRGYRAGSPTLLPVPVAGEGDVARLAERRRDLRLARRVRVAQEERGGGGPVDAPVALPLPSQSPMTGASASSPNSTVGLAGARCCCAAGRTILPRAEDAHGRSVPLPSQSPATGTSPSSP